MALRRARVSDGTDIANVCAQAFWNDELLGDLMHPRRHTYPDDFTGYFLNRFQRCVEHPSHCVFVTFEQGEDGTEVLTGYADWICDSNVEGAGPASETTNHELDHNRAADPLHADTFERAAACTKHHWTGERAKTWLLDLLAVHPDHVDHAQDQGKGLGRKLVEEGIKLAKRDGICASVISSASGEKLYISCGFEAAGWVTEGRDNPLRDLPGGRILFYDVPL